MATLNTNSTIEREPFSGEVYQWVIYTLTVLFCLCGLVGNGKVIWILGFCSQRRYFMIYILNLAIADFGTLLVLLIRDTTLPFHKLQDMTLSVLYSQFFFMHNASLYLLTAISIERCLSVLSPVWYQHHLTSHASTSTFISSLLWIFSGLLSGGLLLFCVLLSFETYFTAVKIICSVNLLVFAPVMVASTVMLLVKIYSQGLQPSRVYSAILVTLLCFIIFAIPLSVVHIILIYRKHYSQMAVEISVLCASFNSSINPLIYYCTGRNGNHWCKESLKVVLQRIFKEETNFRTSIILV